MSGAETSVLHTREQGKRVHILANLGGLVAIAGMERVEPDLLLGALLEVADRLPKMKAARLEELRQRGAAKLKRAPARSPCGGEEGHLGAKPGARTGQRLADRSEARTAMPGSESSRGRVVGETPSR